jgi:thioredoxin-related protein
MLSWFSDDTVSPHEGKAMITRRRFNSLAAGTLATVAGAGRLGATETRYEPLTEGEGFYTWDWFLSSFLELADDLEMTTDEGKRLAILWEQDGCPYCRELHMTNLAIPEIHDYIRDNFNIVQLDIRGARDVVDFDGATLTERDLAKHSAVRFTPTIQFFPESLGTMAGRSGKAAEITRMPGYLAPFHFLTFFQFVRDDAYADGDFRAYLKAKVAAYQEAGQALPHW